MNVSGIQNDISVQLEGDYLSAVSERFSMDHFASSGTVAKLIERLRVDELEHIVIQVCRVIVVIRYF